MALKNDLESEVVQIFAEQWTVENTNNVPDPNQLRLSNHAKNLEMATVLYADLDGSTKMVDEHAWHFSAEIYKAYLRCAARIIKEEGGSITAYDGDRIMAVFTGDYKNTSAVRAAMKIHHAVIYILRPAIKQYYNAYGFTLNHVIGIDTSQLRTARIGVRGNNDLVWIGRAANYAAKLTTLPGSPIWITKDVYDKMNDDVKKSRNQVNMWNKRLWSTMNNMEIYTSDWQYPV